MNDRDTVELARKTRAAQKRYFRKRDNLSECKALERQLDAALDGEREGLFDAPAPPAGADQMAEVRRLMIDMRRYIIRHGILLGECVAWARLKELTGVGQDDGCPSNREAGWNNVR